MAEPTLEFFWAARCVEDVFGNLNGNPTSSLKSAFRKWALVLHPARTWFATRDYRASLMANPASPWPVRLKSWIMLYLLSIVWQHKSMMFFDEFEEWAANQERNRVVMHKMASEEEIITQMRGAFRRTWLAGFAKWLDKSTEAALREVVYNAAQKAVDESQIQSAITTAISEYIRTESFRRALKRKTLQAVQGLEFQVDVTSSGCDR